MNTNLIHRGHPRARRTIDGKQVIWCRYCDVRIVSQRELFSFRKGSKAHHDHLVKQSEHANWVQRRKRAELLERGYAAAKALEPKTEEELHRKLLGDRSCPVCGSTTFGFYEPRAFFYCSRGHHLSPKVGTIYEQSKTPLTTWRVARAMYEATDYRLAAQVVGRILGLSYKASYRMKKRFEYERSLTQTS
jgi:hypothetical protein